MKFKKQTINDNKRGNCFSACIASLLEVEVEDVPNVNDMGNNWYQEFNKWLLSKHSCQMLDVIIDSEYHMPSIPMIAHGKSMNFPDVMHSVLWQNGKMIFDPSPSNKGIDGEPKTYTLLLKDYSK